MAERIPQEIKDFAKACIIADGLSYRKTAETIKKKYRRVVSFGVVRNWSNDGNWKDKRQELEQKAIITAQKDYQYITGLQPIETLTNEQMLENLANQMKSQYFMSDSALTKTIEIIKGRLDEFGDTMKMETLLATAKVLGDHKFRFIELTQQALQDRIVDNDNQPVKWQIGDNVIEF